MSETANTTDRRSERRSAIDERIKANIDWLTTLQEQVDNGKLTEEEKRELIARSMIARELLTERAGEKSRKDPMTGLLNKGAYNEAIEKLVGNGSPFGLLIVDIDHFKKVNDTFGHVVGDAVLIQTAQNLTSHLRQVRPQSAQNDQIFRYGGEEIAVLLPGIHNENDLEKVAEKIRTAVDKSPYFVSKNGESIHIQVTVSIGGGINRNEDPKTFFDRVDTQGLYEAKTQGRNRTIIVR